MKPERVAELRQNLAALAGGSHETSPFAGVRGVHFARLAMIERYQPYGDENRSVRLRNTWLVFVVDFDGPFALVNRNRFSFSKSWVSHFTEQLYPVVEAGPLRDVWNCCEPRRRWFGLRGRDEEFCSDRDLFESSIRGGIVRRYARFYDYPDATLPTVQAALTNQHELVDWLAHDRSHPGRFVLTPPQ